MRVSILMTAYDREPQLAKTLESIDRQGSFEVIIVRDERPREDKKFLNPAPLWNEALKKSTGDLLIIQNAECLHVNSVLRYLVMVPKGQAWFASVMSLNQDGTEDKWYCHPEHRKQPWFFCGAIWKQDMVPWDESYEGYGFEDTQLADDLLANHVRFEWLWPVEALVHHQWHPVNYGESRNRVLYEQKRLHRLHPESR